MKYLFYESRKEDVAKSLSEPLGYIDMAAQSSVLSRLSLV